MYYLETKRLFLKTLSRNEIQQPYVNWLNDPIINQYLESRFTEHTLESCIHFVEELNDSSNHHLFGIFDKKTTQHIGNIKLGFINTHHSSASVGLLIGDKDYWGKGLATEAIISITNWGFQSMDLQKIEASCYDTNIGSLKAFFKAGYTLEGYLRKKVIYKEQRSGCFLLGVLKSEYQKNVS